VRIPGALAIAFPEPLPHQNQSSAVTAAATAAAMAAAPPDQAAAGNGGLDLVVTETSAIVAIILGVTSRTLAPSTSQDIS